MYMQLESPPSRRRGLKLPRYITPFFKIMSPPSRRRGLKSLTLALCIPPEMVASFAEAWIEMLWRQNRRKPLQVASFAEAWIEIVFMAHNIYSISVASFAEAWIEIKSPWKHPQLTMSPPSRRRGLKSP